jgi:hypothetical protein
MTGHSRSPSCLSKYNRRRVHRLFPVPAIQTTRTLAPPPQDQIQTTPTPPPPSPLLRESSLLPLLSNSFPDLYKRPRISNSALPVRHFPLISASIQPGSARILVRESLARVRDSNGGSGAGGQPAGGSVEAPLRHRPHAPVSPRSGLPGPWGEVPRGFYPIPYDLVRGRGHGLVPGLAWACLDAACLWEVEQLVCAVMLIRLRLFCGAAK